MTPRSKNKSTAKYSNVTVSQALPNFMRQRACETHLIKTYTTTTICCVSGVVLATTTIDAWVVLVVFAFVALRFTTRILPFPSPFFLKEKTAKTKLFHLLLDITFSHSPFLGFLFYFNFLLPLLRCVCIFFFGIILERELD